MLLRTVVRATLGVAALILTGSVVLGTGAVASGGATRVLVTEVDASITPVIASHLEDGIERAEDGEFAAYVVELDTPGGLDTSMRDIVQAFLDADVPVVVHVSPRGARAASAGAIITFAANIAAMSPGTAIGAATPVSLEGGGDVERKIVNDAAAFAESIARERERNVEFAIDTVRRGRSVSSSRAVEIGAVDLEASSRRELLRAIDGESVVVGSGDRVALDTADARIERHDLGLFRRILQFLADPNLAFTFLSLGTLGLVYELASPGVGVAGTAGAVFFVLGLFAVAVLPVNAVGLILIGLAAALFIAEVAAPGFAGFGATGVVLLVLGGIFLMDDASGVDVSLGVLIPVALAAGLAVLVASRFALRARHGEVRSGRETLVGRVIVVRHADGATGQAFLDGAWWRLSTAQPPLRPDTLVRVTDVDGLTLVVEPHAEIDVGSSEISSEEAQHEQ
jgi:membrane-bound serine protease (ClpP class)